MCPVHFLIVLVAHLLALYLLPSCSVCPSGTPFLPHFLLCFHFPSFSSLSYPFQLPPFLPSLYLSASINFFYHSPSSLSLIFHPILFPLPQFSPFLSFTSTPLCFLASFLPSLLPPSASSKRVVSQFPLNHVHHQSPRQN